MFLKRYNNYFKTASFAFIGLYFCFYISTIDSESILSLRLVRGNLNETITLTQALDILQKNALEAENELFDLLYKEIKGKNRLPQLLNNIKMESLRYDSKNNILQIKGSKEINEDECFYFTFFVFFKHVQENLEIEKIIFNVNNIFLDDFEKHFPEDVFLPLSKELWTHIEQLFQDKNLNNHLSGIDYAERIIGPFFSMENLEKLAQENIIVKTLLENKSFLANNLSITSEIYRYPYKYLACYYISSTSSRQPILSKAISEESLTYRFGHEFWHHIHIQNLYNKDINSIFENYTPNQEPGSSLERYIETYHPNLYPGLKDAGYTSTNKEQLLFTEGIAYLFGAFLDTEKAGNPIIISRNNENLTTRLRTSDVEIFADLGLIPNWMRPSQINFNKEFIDSSYYALLLNHR